MFYLSKNYDTSYCLDITQKNCINMLVFIVFFYTAKKYSLNNL